MLLVEVTQTSYTHLLSTTQTHAHARTITIFWRMKDLVNIFVMDAALSLFVILQYD